jgi:hypothetical protein
MKTASLFTPLLLSVWFSLSITAAVTPRAEEYTSVMLFNDKDFKNGFLTDRYYHKYRNSGYIIIAYKF